MRNDLDDQRAKYYGTRRTEKICLDHMGLISLNEEQLTAIFNLFDPNSDGLISKEKFKPAYRDMFENYGAPVTDKDVERLFNKFDTQDAKGKNKRGGDGYLNFTEFSMLVMNRMKT